MKKFVCSLLLVLGVMVLSILLDSCQKYESLEPGIVYTDYPPESLFQNGYAESYRLWIEKSDYSNTKDRGQGCLTYYDNNTGNTITSQCGVWKLLPAKKFWGIKDGIMYISKSQDWYLLSPELYYNSRDLIEKRGTLVGYMCINCDTPWGQLKTLNGFE